MEREPVVFSCPRCQVLFTDLCGTAEPPDADFSLSDRHMLPCISETMEMVGTGTFCDECFEDALDDFSQRLLAEPGWIESFGVLLSQHGLEKASSRIAQAVESGDELGALRMARSILDEMRFWKTTSADCEWLIEAEEKAGELRHRLMTSVRYWQRKAAARLIQLGKPGKDILAEILKADVDFQEIEAKEFPPDIRFCINEDPRSSVLEAIRKGEGDELLEHCRPLLKGKLRTDVIIACIRCKDPRWLPEIRESFRAHPPRFALMAFERFRDRKALPMLLELVPSYVDTRDRHLPQMLQTILEMDEHAGLDCVYDFLDGWNVASESRDNEIPLHCANILAHRHGLRESLFRLRSILKRMKSDIDRFERNREPAETREERLLESIFGGPLAPDRSWIVDAEKALEERFATD